MTIKLAKEDRINVKEPGNLYTIMQRILMRASKIDRNKEHFWLVCVNDSNHILNIELISLGTVDSTLITPMEVFSFALQKREIHNTAIKVIMVHNHPSKVLLPSKADKEVTEKMMAVGFLVNIPILDHLIITEEAYYSFAEMGLLERIHKNSNIDLTFQKQEQQKKEIEEVRKKLLDQYERKSEKTKLATAKSLFKKGVSIQIISEATGLNLQELTAILTPKKKAK